jgi:hypothetical protein
VRYDLFRYSESDGRTSYAFVADDEHKETMLEVQADGAPTEWVWSCEADTAEDAIQAMNDHLDANDWHLEEGS